MHLTNCELQTRLQDSATNTTQHWDEHANLLRERRNNAQGWERRQLSNDLYRYLKRVKATRALERCRAEGGNLFRAFGTMPHRKVLPIDEAGIPLKVEDAILAFEEHLGKKVKAVRQDVWEGNRFTEWEGSGDIFGDIAVPVAKQLRAGMGKGIGLDGITPQAVKCLPDAWLTCIPKCFQNSFRNRDVAMTSWNGQRLKPLPKLRRRCKNT
eukprot:979475-Amphidinium_carterae.1